MSGEAQSNWKGIIAAISMPLGFFVLALLVVESFMGAVLIFSDLAPDHKFWGMLCGVGMFVLVVWVVRDLVIRCPKNLMYDAESHLKDRPEVIATGTGTYVDTANQQSSD